MKHPELRIEVNPNGVTRIRGFYSGTTQKRALFTMAAKLLPALGQIDDAIRKT